MNAIKKRVTLLAGNIPYSFRRDFLRYWNATNKILSKIENVNNLYSGIPFWYFLPEMILKRFPSKMRAQDKRFLDDINWGQYCYYFAIRMQDDIYDCQEDDTALLFVSDHFLIEAEQNFRKYFDTNSIFWEIKDEYLRKSFNGIIEARELQTKPDSDLRRLLSEYVNISSIFKIGSVAVCEKLSAMNECKRIIKFADEIAIASQIVDDLEDINEDLERNRFNYVVQTLIDFLNVDITKSRDRDELLKQIMKINCIKHISDQVYSHLERAEKIILHVIPELVNHVRYFRKCYNVMEKKFYLEKLPQFSRNAKRRWISLQNRKWNGNSDAIASGRERIKE